jgi:hypothetical protein
MKLFFFVVLLGLAACASSSPPAAKPTAGTSTTNTSTDKTTVNQDAYECERQAAITAGAGSRAQAFNECMRSKGHGAKR